MKQQHIHIVGIGGSGATGLARYLHTIGFEVSGSDSDIARTAELKQLGLHIADVHDPRNITDPDMVLFSPGVFAADPEMTAARKKGIPVLSWQDFLGRYLSRRPGQGFMAAGTFGKGSTAAVLGHILESAYLDPLVLLGVVDQDWGSNLRPGFGESWVIEADEYNRHFHHFHPSFAVLTSLEHEHVSTYPRFNEYQQAFKGFFQRMVEPGMVVVNKAISPELLNGVVPDAALTYGLNESADVQGRVLEESSRGTVFELAAPKFNIDAKTFELNIPGRFHVENTVGAVALALAAGVDVSAVNAGLARFRGLKSRFEVLSKGDYCTVFDFAHTPSRIRPVIEEARRVFPGKRVVVLFEPHLYSRTKQFLNEFKLALTQADRAYITDIYPSREAHSSLAREVHARDIVGMNNETISYVGPLEEGVAMVQKVRTERDVVLVLGAGPIQNTARPLAG